MPSRRRFLSIVAAAASMPHSVARAALPLTVSTWRGTAMGALASMTLVHADRTKARALIDACVAEIARLESILSLYRADSALSRLNAEGTLASPPQELVELLSFGLSLAKTSDGAFDPTIQPLYRLYADHFARLPDAGPSRQQIERVLQRVDYRFVDVASARIHLRRPGMAVTLNGIAQGFVTDRVAELLHAAGLAHVLIDLGEARALGRREDGTPWRAALRDPVDRARTLLDLRLGEEPGSWPALATSAGYGTPFGPDAHIHHLLDPHTGASANHYLSVSVAAPRATLADGLSTTLFVLPPQRGAAILQRYPAARAFLVDASGRLTQHGAA